MLGENSSTLYCLRLLLERLPSPAWYHWRAQVQTEPLPRILDGSSEQGIISNQVKASEKGMT